MAARWAALALWLDGPMDNGVDISRTPVGQLPPLSSNICRLSGGVRRDLVGFAASNLLISLVSGSRLPSTEGAAGQSA